jgi:UDP-glucuronate 4-epimerase
LQRDFTYIDDIVEGIIRVQNVIPQPESGWTPETGSAGTSSAPYRVYNIGHGHPVKLMDFIAGLENALGIEAEKNFMPMQPGDVYTTYADTEDLYQATGYKPSVSIEEGVERFVRWFREYYE